MLIMTMQSVLLLVVTFAVFAGIGWALGAKRRQAVRSSAFEDVEDAVTVQPSAELIHYDMAVAAETFTSGIVVPFKSAEPAPVAKPEPSKFAYAPPEVTPRLDTAALRMTSPYAERNLQGRVSSLASMTPESVESAVQQAGSGLEPVRLNAPRGAIDDLTVISGVGPGNQQELNELGIYHFWQIAGWTPENVAWVSNRIRFPKRIVRENWMAQAAKLARMN